MRVEHSKPLQPVTPRLISFLEQALSGQCLDDYHDPETEHIDYVCLNGLLAVEVKSLEGEPGVRVDNFVETLRRRPDFPPVFEAATLDTIAARMENPAQIIADVVGRIGRTIVTHLKKANDQLLAHTIDYPRKNIFRLVIIVNENHAEYAPDVVLKVLKKEMNRQERGGFRYENIDAVWYITERHSTLVEGRLVLPILTVTAPGIRHCEWKPAVVDYVVKKWASFGSGEFFEDAGDPGAYVASEYVPETMKRHEAWAVNYRRDPYFRTESDERVKEIFEEITLITRVYMTHGSPIVRDPEKVMINFAHFTHIREEMKIRGILFSDIPITLEREIAAARRLRMPEVAIDWLKAMHTEREHRRPSVL